MERSCFVNGLDTEYLFALRAAGIPIVLVSTEVEGLDCPVVSADNFTGGCAAAEHLVGHGHRRIAFVGNLSQLDIRERYEAYRRTLTHHGIEPDDRLLFEVADNIEGGGAEGAEAMLAAGMPSTAVVAGTDSTPSGSCVVCRRRASQFQATRRSWGSTTARRGL